ncbi:S1-like domain-containing RNA-binding protein [Dasania sp. GY-MA-18]|uniref:S1-like domain-containing RNA-binding protein n=1 Tax=Dasania phycosphaerae TaxID=2950436 RepID=A0A9J6RLU9_9GAMM|nr:MULTISPECIES: S1-like domain-containing RNA-binding protein [Dasania]MCR8922737.1 S1-like domain-containing RNA-binding protein [Dasania sp. GY-MA-18]MCZ0865167.1 S1-like domain-containing RNA-binding protein [Dasania phycosphaerae]MCZ0868893.1 S1-like domain-containing RNA-binding protein [Dasania phycosphaerae]
MGQSSTVQIGKTNTLSISKINAVGAMLDGGPLGSILLTATANTPSLVVGENIEVFVYLDAEGELAATTLKPKAQLGEIAWLQVADVTNVGGFLDWGLPKDLFIPFAEQQFELQVGRHVLAKVYLDKKNRLTASTRLDHLLSDDEHNFKDGEKVNLLIAEKTELGYKAIINHQCFGLLYDNELIQPLKKGQSHTGYIKKIRSDNKIDLSLNPIGFNQQQHDAIGQSILDKLKENDGFMLLNDKSPPEAIYKVFGVSKKAFKKACGTLYKKKLIDIEKQGIRLR